MSGADFGGGEGLPRPAGESSSPSHPEGARPLRIAYFIPDLSDPAAARRVRMLKAGGAQVAVFGFNRTRQAIHQVSGAPALSFGRTEGGKLKKRIGSVLGALFRLPTWAGRVRGFDVLLARNLEMLALASAARAANAKASSLVYEVLDVHRVMLGTGRASRAMRALEGFLARDASRVLVSSPAFEEEYFKKRTRIQAQSLLVENKVLRLEPDTVLDQEDPTPPAPPPWRIGWYGVIRCKRSLKILTDLAARLPGRVEVEIRGRPYYEEFQDFEAEVARSPGLSFHGPYDPSELSALYGAVHFVWALDFYEEGLNSSWLLPNRLYEGQLHHAVPLAMADVETGRWLKAMDAGVLLKDPEAELVPFFDRLTEQDHAVLKARTAAIPKAALVSDQTDCEALVDALRQSVRR
jgi:hypothetical protein